MNISIPNNLMISVKIAIQGRTFDEVAAIVPELAFADTHVGHIGFTAGLFLDLSDEVLHGIEQVTGELDLWRDQLIHPLDARRIADAVPHDDLSVLLERLLALGEESITSLTITAISLGRST